MDHCSVIGYFVCDVIDDISPAMNV